MGGLLRGGERRSRERGREGGREGGRDWSLGMRAKKEKERFKVR